MVDTGVLLGVIYLIIGIFGVAENVLTVVLITGHKDMQNPTYSYIVHACACDAIVLLIIAIMPGLLLLFPIMQTATVSRICAYILAIGWYADCCFMILTAITRWLQLEHPHKLKTYFTVRLIRLTAGIAYISPACIGTWFLYISPRPFTFVPAFYTWSFDRTTSWGDGLAITNTAFNIICGLLIALINSRSCWSIRHTRLQVLNVSTRRNRQREIRLFIQCAITGTIFILAILDFFVSASLKNASYVDYTITNFIWISYHIHQPILYMVMNAGFRQTFLERVVPKTLRDHFIACRRCLPILSKASETGNSAGPMNKYSDVTPQQTAE